MASDPGDPDDLRSVGGEEVLVMPATLDRHMRPTDAFAWYMERDPLLRSTVVSVGVLDRLPDLEVLRERMERASRVVTAFRDRLVVPPLRMARPRWVQVDHLDLAWHMRHVAVAAPGTLTQLLDLARTEATTAFDPARPLWSVTTVEGLEGGRAGFVMKYHHSLMDGIGGIALVTELFDLERDALPPGHVVEPPGEQVEGWRLLRDTLAYDAGRMARLAVRSPVAALRTSAHVARHPGDTARTMASVARTVEPYFTTLSPLMQQRRLHRSLDVLEVPLDSLRAAAAAHGGHLNDAFLAAVTGGLRRYHAEHGHEVHDLRVTLPISVRRPDDPPGGNRITLMRFALPAGGTDAGERLRATHQVVERVRAERSLPHTQGIAAALNLLPPAFVGSMLKHVDFLASDVPGVPVPLYLAGAKVERWYPFGPTIGASVNLTLMSYTGTCCIGINVDTGAVPDPERLVSCLREGFREVLALAGDHDGVRSPRDGT
jgi:WS/DGAT/MGAT family acyltransferase